MATASRGDRRCAYPLGCGFCGSPKRVEQAENASVLAACTSLVQERSAHDGRFHARDHGVRVVAKAGMHWPVVWTPRAAAA